MSIRTHRILRSLILALFMVVIVGQPVFAHSVTVGDSNPTDWCGSNASNDTLATSSGACGREAIWQDSNDEQRKPFGSDNWDIDEVRWTGDSINLYILVKFNGEVTVGGNGSPSLHVMIDHPSLTNGEYWIADSTETTTTTEWNRQILTRFGPGGSSAQPRFYRKDASYNDNYLTGSAQVYNYSGSGYIEISIPWTELGVSFSGGDQALFFGVGMGKQNSSNEQTWEISSSSDLLDTASSGDAWNNELSDGNLSNFHGVTFNDNPTAIALSTFDATSRSVQPILPGAVGLVLVLGGLGGLTFWRRK